MGNTIQSGQNFGQIVLQNKELMQQLRKENPDASIWGDNGIIAKAAEMAGFTDKNGDGSILDEANKIYAGDTIDFSKAAKEKLAQAQNNNAVNTENSTEAPTNKPEYSPFITDNKKYLKENPIESLLKNISKKLLSEDSSQKTNNLLEDSSIDQPKEKKSGGIGQWFKEFLQHDNFLSFLNRDKESTGSIAEDDSAAANNPHENNTTVSADIATEAPAESEETVEEQPAESEETTEEEKEESQEE